MSKFKEFEKKYDIPALGILIGMFLIILIFWNFVAFYPIKLFTVLLHELSHGLAAILTGGKILRIEISANLGGLCYTSGGSRFIILSAGYLGSMIFGGLIMYTASKSKSDKTISIIIGAIILIITALYVRTLFGAIFAVLFGIGMIGMGIFAPMRVNDIFLKFLGMTSALYAIIDIKQDLIDRTVQGSDAYALSKEFFMPPVFWGLLWILLAVTVTFFIFKESLKKTDYS